MAALGEVPPEFAIAQPAERPLWQGDQAWTDLEDAPDMDPSFNDEETDSSSEEEQGEGEDGEESEETDVGSEKEDGEAAAEEWKSAQGDKPKDTNDGQGAERDKDQNNDGALTAIQRSTVSELFQKKSPEKVSRRFCTKRHLARARPHAR